MNSIAKAILKAERERQGRETAEIAVELCITQRYLRAIERDDLKSLPGSFFYKSFVRQYAKILHVDETLIQPGVEALTNPLDPPPLPGADTRYTPTNLDFGKSPLRNLDPIVRDGNRRYFPERRIGLPLAALAAMVLATSGFYAWYNNPHVPPVRRQARQSRAPRVPASRFNPSARKSPPRLLRPPSTSPP